MGRKDERIRKKEDESTGNRRYKRLKNKRKT